MHLLSCLFPEAGERKRLDTYLWPVPPSLEEKTASQVLRTGNASFLEVLHAISAMESGSLPTLADACQAMCEHLDADQVSVCLLGSHSSATVVACAGLEADEALGRSQPLSVTATDMTKADTGCSVEDLALQCLEANPKSPVVFLEGGRRGNPGDELPDQWRHLNMEHGCRHFAASAMVVEGLPIGVLALASKTADRPAGWSQEVLTSLAMLLAGQVHSGGDRGAAIGQLPGQALMLPRARARLPGRAVADALSALAATATLSGVVAAVGDAALEVSGAVAYVQGQARVALLHSGAGAAAIFQHHPSGPEPAASTANGFGSSLVSRRHRSSCEYVMSMSPASTTSTVPSSVSGLPSTPRRGGRTRQSIEAVDSRQSSKQFTLNGGHVTAVVAERPRACSFTDAQLPGGSRKSKSRLSFAIPSRPSEKSDLLCKGHTLPLSGTLLADALSKEASGLCVSDCASYVQDKHAFPRDAVLSRDGVMPLSLALVTLSSDGQPLLALYVAYSFSLPQPLLQAVVEGLQQLLQVMLPLVKAKLEGLLRPEWEYLQEQLEEVVRVKTGGGKQSRHTHLGFASATDAQSSMPNTQHHATSDPNGAPEPLSPAAAAGIDGGKGERIIFEGPPGPQLQLNPQPIVRSGESRINSPFTTVAASELTVPAVGRRPSALRRLLGVPGGPAVASEQPLTYHQTSQTSWTPPSDSDSSPHPLSAAPQDSSCSSTTNGTLTGGKSPAENRVLNTVHSVSFRLVAAKSPRGASRLAPIITIMHERLKAAQAAQMTNGRTEARKADLQSVKMLEEIGKGGYGTVYRGTYHGAEVAVKVIQNMDVAAPYCSTVDAEASLKHSASTTLHKQNLHDAIELVASVSVSHPNIVQVLAFFTDCKLHFGPVHSGMGGEGERTSVLFDSMDVPDATQVLAGVHLVHMPSLLESPASGQDQGGISVALVMEYMDAGSLSDAILKRVFFERLDVNHPATVGRKNKALLAVSMRSVYATLLEIALALRHMHSLHLVHCDLKPQNVLLKSAPRDPRGFVAKLSDFGLSKTMAHDEDGQLVIDEAVASGTITHIAPEIFMGKKSLGAAVDIYAFGILMYQVLCGMRLYDGLTAQEIANMVAHRMLRPTFPQWVPGNYRALAECCWHPLPSVRPTADDLVRQLEKLSDFRRKGGRPQSTGNGQ